MWQVRRGHRLTFGDLLGWLASCMYDWPRGQMGAVRVGVVGGLLHVLATSWCISGVVCLFVGCLTSQQQASVSRGRICEDNFTCCHTEIEVADQTFYLTVY